MSTEVAEEVWYPNPDELGISESMRAEISQLLLDQTIELKPLGRAPHGPEKFWDAQTIVAYGRWLYAIVEPDLPPDTPLMQPVIRRASYLNLGIDDRVIYDCEEIGNMPTLQRLLGQKPTKPYNGVPNSEIVEQAGQFMSETGSLLDSRELDQLADEGVLPTYDTIQERFGTLGKFHEAIGKRVVVKGWEEEDYIEWGVAVSEQNPGMILTGSIINKLSHQKLGASNRTIARTFGTLLAFQTKVAAELERRQSAKDDPAAQTERRKGLYLVAAELLPGCEESVIKQITRAVDSDTAANEIVRLGFGVDYDEVRAVARDYGLDEVIWPPKRFQNYNFSLAEAA